MLENNRNCVLIATLLIFGKTVENFGKYIYFTNLGLVFQKGLKVGIDQSFWSLKENFLSAPRQDCRSSNFQISVLIFLDISRYDAVSEVRESGGHWRSDFQIGSCKGSTKKLFVCIETRLSFLKFSDLFQS